MRERGLKQHINPGILITKTVAPHAGAWIETQTECTCLYELDRRSPCGSVD